MDLGAVGPQIVVLVGAAAALVAAIVLPRRAQWATAPIALGTLATAAGGQVALLAGSDRLVFDRIWALDAATGITSVGICGVAAAAVLLGREWMAADRRGGEYPAVILLGALGAMVLAGAADLNELVVGVVLSSATGYVLAAYHRADPMSVEAGMSYFLIGGLSNIVLLVGAVLVLAAAGTTHYPAVGVALLAGDPWLVVPAGICLAVGLAYKAGAVPANAWVPDVAQGAPLPSAAFLTAAPKLGGVVALARLVVQLGPDSGVVAVVAVIATASMTIGNLAALAQDDVRRLLGWSSVAQAGYALAAVAAVPTSEQAVPALVLFLVAYAVSNTAAFAVVGSLRGRTALADYEGLARERPVHAWALTLALLSLTGIPPLAGFAGKLGVFTALLDAGLGWLAVVVVVNTVVSLVYYLRVIAACHLGSREGHVHLLGRWSATAVALTTIATVALGPAAQAVLGAAQGRPLLP